MRGYTQERLAELIGMQKAAISKLELGRVQYAQNMLALLAEALDAPTPADLLRPPHSLDGSSGRLTPLVGNVGAGGGVQRGEAHMDYVEPPAGVPGKLEALRVEGLSMYPELQPGDLIFYDTADERGPDAHIGHVVAAETEDGDMLVKALRPGSVADVYDLHSHNPAEPPRENVRLKSAARVIFVDRRGRQ